MVSNHRPLPCQGSALPLSYGPAERRRVLNVAAGGVKNSCDDDEAVPDLSTVVLVRSDSGEVVSTDQRSSRRRAAGGADIRHVTTRVGDRPAMLVAGGARIA